MFRREGTGGYLCHLYTRHEHLLSMAGKSGAQTLPAPTKSERRIRLPVRLQHGRNVEGVYVTIRETLPLTEPNGDSQGADHPADLSPRPMGHVLVQYCGYPGRFGSDGLFGWLSFGVFDWLAFSWLFLPGC